MDWIQFGYWETVGAIVAIVVLAFLLFPYLKNTAISLDNFREFNSIEVSDGLFTRVKIHRWRLTGIAIITVSLVAGLTQKSILLGLSTCATLIFVLSPIAGNYVVDNLGSTLGSNRTVTNLISGFYTEVTFIVMILIFGLFSIVE